MIRVTSFGKTENDSRDRYIKQIKLMVPFEWTEISLKKCPDKRSPTLLPEEEKFLKNVKGDFFLCDVGGKTLNSDQFYEWLFKDADRHLLIGPAVGFHPEFVERAKGKISLSPLTLTHGLAQLVLAESIFRSICILKNHPFVK